MELKCDCRNNIQQNFEGSNRTFMELKFKHRDVVDSYIKF